VASFLTTHSSHSRSHFVPIHTRPSTCTWLAWTSTIPPAIPLGISPPTTQTHAKPNLPGGSFSHASHLLSPRRIPHPPCPPCPLCLSPPRTPLISLKFHRSLLNRRPARPISHTPRFNRYSRSTPSPFTFSACTFVPFSSLEHHPPLRPAPPARALAFALAARPDHSPLTGINNRTAHR
jgi:hypothetical protein